MVRAMVLLTNVSHQQVLHVMLWTPISMTVLPSAIQSSRAHTYLLLAHVPIVTIQSRCQEQIH